MGYAPDITLGFLSSIAFVASLVVCYAVVVVKNWKRDVYHQIPLLKAFLYAFGWTPVTLICILLMINMMG